MSLQFNNNSSNYPINYVVPPLQDKYLGAIQYPFFTKGKTLCLSPENAAEMSPTTFWNEVASLMQSFYPWTTFEIPGKGFLTRKQLQQCLELNVEMGPISLLNWSKEITSMDLWNRFPLQNAHRTVIAGHLDQLKILITLYPNTINEIDYRGATPLQYAVRLGHFEMVKVLLDAGARINATGPKTISSPLFQAIRLQDLKLVNFLIDKGAAINQIDASLMTPLGIAIREGDQKIVELLLKRGANVNIKNPSVFPPIFESICRNRLEAFKLLIDKVKNINYTDENGVSALKLAVKFGRTEMARQLINKGAPPSSVALPKKCAPGLLRSIHNIEYAAIQEQSDILELLFNNGVKKINHRVWATYFFRWAATIQPTKYKTLFSKISAVPIDDEMRSKTSQILQAQSIGHVFEIEKTFVFKRIHHQESAVTEELGGHAAYWLSKFIHYAKIMKTRFPELGSQTDFLKEVLSFTLENLHGKYEKILERIRSGLPTLLLSGLTGHYVSVIIWKDFFILCNRGEHSKGNFKVFRFNREKLTVELLEKIVEHFKNRSVEFLDLFHFELPRVLEFRENEPEDLASTLENDCPFKEQTVGNCSYACVEGGIWGLLILQKLFSKGIKTEEIPLNDVKAAIKQEKRRFLLLQGFSEAYHLERYLGARILRSPKNNALPQVYKLDSDLINTAFSKAHRNIDIRISDLFIKLEKYYRSFLLTNKNLFL